MTTIQQKTKTKSNLTINDIRKNPTFQEFITLRNLKKTTQTLYATTLKAYITSQPDKPTIDQLLTEADTEEEQQIRPKKRKIKQRFNTFKQHLQKNQYKNRTINIYISYLKTFYTHYDITPPHITKNKITPQSYKEIITKEDIIRALETCNSNQMKAIILFMASSGNASNETSNITITDFIEATREYHNETRIEHVITQLIRRKDLIPTFTITRQKTGVPYYTYCTPEATHQILIYLQERLIQKGIQPDEKLFGVSSAGIGAKFLRLNDKCNFQWQNDSHRFFHSHGLRKFFATTMLSNGVSELTVDFWEGRSVSSTQRSYYHPSPEQMKKRYIAAMDCVTFYNHVSYTDITSEEKVELEKLREADRVRQRELEDIRRRLEALDLDKLHVR